MKPRTVILGLVLILAISCQIQAADQGKLTIILLDQLSLKEIEQWGGPELLRLFDRSAAALMNVRTEKGIESAYTYAAFGSGSRGEGYGAMPGLLGQILKEHHHTVAAFGNSDYGPEERRDVVTIAMDDSGYLFFGDVSQQTLIRDPAFPGQMRTYYEKMAAAFRDAYQKYDLLLLEIGDFARIKTGLERLEIRPEAGVELVRGTFIRFDLLLRRILATINPVIDQLMLVAPTPDPAEGRKGYKLSWVLLHGPDGGKGLLTTATTRRFGLATITDLAPTVLRFFRIPAPVLMNGRPLRVLPGEKGGLSYLLRRNDQIVRTSEWRPWFIKAFILIQIIVISGATLSFFLRHFLRSGWWRILSGLLLGIMLIPSSFFLLSPYLIANFYAYLGIVLLWIFLLVLILSKAFRDPLSSVIVVATATGLPLLIDILRGSPRIASSLLGYCPIIGARFYGIGNEYMGILIGAALIGWTGLLDRFEPLARRKYLLTPLVFAPVILMIGFPTLGANFGGILTAMVACTFTYILMFEKKRRKRILVMAGLLLFAGLSIIIISDTYGWTGEQSHFGRTIALLKEKGGSALTDLLWRKLSMNLKLLRWTIWTRVLITFIVVLALLFKRPRGVLHELVQARPHLTLGFFGVILGSLVTMFVNDSGVVAAATLLFFAIFTLLYLVLQQLKEGREPVSAAGPDG